MTERNPRRRRKSPRRAGGRWRVRVQEWDPRTRRYGTAYHIAADKRAGLLPTSPDPDDSEHTRHIELPGTEFDELAIEGWCHLEGMNDTDWWMDVGGVTLTITADRDGRPRTVSVYGPDDYASPVPGCEYHLVWSGPHQISVGPDQDGGSGSPQAALTAEIKPMITEYTVCALPEDDPNHRSYALTVAYRGDGRWAVTHQRMCLGADGEWDWEPSPSARDDEWLTTHRFDLETALRLAVEHAPNVTVNGLRAADVPAWAAARRAAAAPAGEVRADGRWREYHQPVAAGEVPTDD